MSTRIYQKHAISHDQSIICDGHFSHAWWYTSMYSNMVSFIDARTQQHWHDFQVLDCLDPRNLGRLFRQPVLVTSLTPGEEHLGITTFSVGWRAAPYSVIQIQKIPKNAKNKCTRWNIRAWRLEDQLCFGKAEPGRADYRWFKFMRPVTKWLLDSKSMNPDSVFCSKNSQVETEWQLEMPRLGINTWDLVVGWILRMQGLHSLDFYDLFL